jgi:peptidoglycan/LPS O-acetylase OafA/YrhL
MKYRADIDGLRALAVLPVVLYHMGFSRYMPGGFIGVDIFFVISGYLITSIITANIESNSYSLADFYNRRIKRIFPVLFVLYITVAILSLLSHFPSESETVGNSIASSVFFVSNILFYYSSGYFDTTSDSNFLLHTWSLSVEEQFYVLFPIILYTMKNLTKNQRLLTLTTIAVASFLTSTYLVKNDASAAYYLVHSRAWELMLGALLAIHAPKSLTKPAAELLGITGLVLILSSCFFINKATPFPGLAALPACLGTVAIIYSGISNTWISTILGNPILRFFGLISYSLYLWHWPIWVFFDEKFQFEGLSGFLAKIGLIILSIIVATISWQYIEKPFRQKRSWLNQRNVLTGGVIVMCLMTVFAFSLSNLNRIIWSPTPEAEKINEYVNYGGIKFNTDAKCFLHSEDNSWELFEKDKCLNISLTKPNILVMGDSHAAHLLWGLNETHPQLNFLQANASGCKPYLDTKGAAICKDLMNYIITSFIPNQKLDNIIISARWKVSDIALLEKTVSELAKYTTRITVMGRIEEYNQALPRLIAQGMVRAPNDVDNYVTQFERKDIQEIDNAFLKINWPANVKYLSTYDIMQNQCNSLLINGVPKQFDYGHLTAEGSSCLATYISVN